MGIIRLTLITLAGLWAAMLYFGRDEGLPEDRIGRDPATEPAVVVPDAALDEVLSGAPLGAPEPQEEATAAPAPEPVVTPDPQPAAEPEATASETATEAEAETAQPTPEPQPAAPAVAAEPAVAQPAPEPAEPEPAAEPETTTLYVTGSTVNVRSGPSTVYDPITSLGLGSAVQDLGDAGEGWRMILLDNGDVGYMSGDFLSPEAP